LARATYTLLFYASHRGKRLMSDQEEINESGHALITQSSGASEKPSPSQAVEEFLLSDECVLLAEPIVVLDQGWMTDVLLVADNNPKLALKVLRAINKQCKASGKQYASMTKLKHKIRRVLAKRTESLAVEMEKWKVTPENNQEARPSIPTSRPTKLSFEPIAEEGKDEVSEKDAMQRLSGSTPRASRSSPRASGGMDW